MQEARWEPRRPKGGVYALTWRGRNAHTFSTEGKGVDISSSGVGIECPSELTTGSIVYVQSRDGVIGAQYEVVHCTPRGGKFYVGLELRDEVEETDKPADRHSDEREPNHYETLQISSNADIQTIHRVFRMMAARFHPDNPETGDVDQFLRMKRAYAVLSDPERRAEYDFSLRKEQESGPRSIFGLKDFVTGVEAETNRRLGVLCLLYNKRQTAPDKPGISLLDLEHEMGFPREYLSFTLWYLRSKDFVTVEDNSDYALTATGTDFVEEKAVHQEIVSKMLNPGLRYERSARSKARQNHTPPPPRKLLS